MKRVQKFPEFIFLQPCWLGMVGGGGLQCQASGSLSRVTSPLHSARLAGVPGGLSSRGSGLSHHYNAIGMPLSGMQDLSRAASAVKGERGGGCVGQRSRASRCVEVPVARPAELILCRSEDAWPRQAKAEPRPRQAKAQASSREEACGSELIGPLSSASAVQSSRGGGTQPHVTTALAPLCPPRHRPSFLLLIPRRLSLQGVQVCYPGRTDVWINSFVVVDLVLYELRLLI